MERDDKKAKADKVIEHCMANGDSLGEAMVHADSYLQAEQVDTREKLEADVHQYANPDGYKNTLGASWEEKMLSFLDRQEAITKRETKEYWANVYNKDYDQYETQIAELIAERDELAHELRRARKAAKRWHELASGYRDKAAQFVEIIETLTATLDRKNARIKRLRGKLKRARNK